jgi:hypothetical protein
MGSTSVLVIGEEPMAQITKFTGHGSTGRDHPEWNYFICTIDVLPLKAGASGQVVRSERNAAGEADFVDVTSGKAGRARKDAVDLEAMRDGAGQVAASAWDCAAGVRSAHPGNDFATLARLYAQDPVVRATLQASRHSDEDAAEWLSLPREDYIAFARDEALLFAFGQVVHDGKLLIDNSEEAWTAEMARGPVSLAERKREMDAWHDEFNALVDALPGDTFFTSALVKV